MIYNSILFNCKLNVIFNYNLFIVKFNFFYKFQFKAPWDHSWKRPIKRIKKNKILESIQFIKLEVFIIEIIGKIKVISTSKIKKIIVIKKNRMEKGIREELKGSKPHSKGEIFSRSKSVFLETKTEIFITTWLIIKIKVISIINNRIIYTKYLDLLIGSQLYFLYYINNLF